MVWGRWVLSRVALCPPWLELLKVRTASSLPPTLGHFSTPFPPSAQNTPLGAVNPVWGNNSARVGWHRGLWSPSSGRASTLRNQTLPSGPPGHHSSLPGALQRCKPFPVWVLVTPEIPASLPDPFQMLIKPFANQRLN